MPDPRPIFVVGCPRSGTTLLQVMLHAHPRIAVPPESRYLMRVYRERAGFGDLRDPDARRRLGRSITADRKFRDYGLDRRSVVAEVMAAPPTVGSAVEAVHRAYARAHAKERWGEKRPGYFQDLPSILRMFPDAQIVHLVRDGRDCVASLRRMPWFDEDSVAAMVLWMRAVDAGARAAARLGPGAFHELRYEDLVADPDAALRRLCAFLGEDFDPAMAAPAPVAASSVPRRKTWHDRTRDPVDPSAVAHGSGLEQWERDLMNHVAGDRLRAHGYPVEPPSAPPTLRHLLHYARVRAEKELMTGRRRAEDRLRDVRLRDDVASVTSENPY